MSISSGSSGSSSRKRKNRLFLFLALFVIACFCSFNVFGFFRLGGKNNNNSIFTLQSYYANSRSVYYDSVDNDNNSNTDTTITSNTTFTNTDTNADEKDEEDKNLNNNAAAASGDIILKEQQLELNVPFYVYDDDEEINWLNATFDGRPLPDHAFATLKTYKKHSDDYYLLRNAMKHPMRTNDINEAKLVFIPTLLNLFSAMLYNKEKRKLCLNTRQQSNRINNSNNKVLCFDGVQKNWFNTLSSLDELLGKFINGQSKGKDHVIVASHFTSRHFLDLPNVQSCHQFIFETKDVPSVSTTATRTIRIPSMYTGNPCPHSSKTSKTHDFALIAQMLENDTTNPRYPLFQSRRDICSWLAIGNHSVSHCGSGVEQCLHLPHARYGFHIRGDSFGSNRLMDTLQSGTVPLFTDEEQYMILPDIFPWRELSYLVNVTSFKDFQVSLDDLLSLPEGDYQNKIRLIQQHQNKFDPSNIYQFDLLMASLAKRLGFQ